MQEILSKKKIGERIRSVRLERHYSQAFVASILNISRSNYSQIEIGNQFPSFESLSKIASYYSKSYEWLLHGQEADPYVENSARSSQEIQAEKKVPSKILYVTESAEYARNLKSESYLKHLPVFDLPGSFIVDHARYRAFTIDSSGNNMLKYINTGDLLIGKFIKNFSQILIGHTYVIVTNTEIVFCEVENILFEEGIIVCKCGVFSNPKSILPFNNIQEIWEAVGKYSKIIQSVVEELETTVQSFQALVQKLENEVARLAKT
ncbi:helix-turn-helix domain-containing protein [Mucilaginibacter paludis]|uniref:Helix-turn-helix domain protein n=1 Tax=Mucilaginibacter paludis DSM 18603 TaxID=714943 RepID=H1YEV7_9SPHI|nr:helix-turn-helix transcriptional regulator [Mucilaginibacter paludis]EHQ24374.1 helix-turn-helix domain protein [Mucilaginibacter paludis DSM 18603]